MGKFLRILENADPERSRFAANSGKYAIKDALEAQGITCKTDPYNSSLTFDFNGYTFSVTITEKGTSSAPEEEQETVSPEDKEIQDEINSLRMGGDATKNDPNVQRVRKDLGNKVGAAYGKISQTIGRI